MPRVLVKTTGRVLDLPDNANLREAFLRSGARLYEGLDAVKNCGGHARCGMCRLLVEGAAAATSAPTPGERVVLAGCRSEIRLACQTQVRGDLTADPNVRS